MQPYLDKAENSNGKIKFIFETNEFQNRIFHIGSSKETLILDLANLIMNELKIEGAIIPPPILSPLWGIFKSNSDGEVCGLLSIANL